MTDTDREWPIGLGAVLYGDAEPRAGTRRDLWHVTSRYEDVDGEDRLVELWDGSHTRRVWVRLDALMADYVPAGWCFPTGEKPLYHLTRNCGVDDDGDLMTDGGTEQTGISQATLDGHKRERPTCQPPHHPEQTCQNHVERVITVYYAGPAMTEIDWWVCEDHADEVRETGEVREDREYSEARDGYGVMRR